MKNNATNILTEYYEKTLSDFGANADGVGWGSPVKHQLRLDAFVHVIELDNIIKNGLIDVGCGYGEMLNIINKDKKLTYEKYLGIDSSNGMILEAKKLYPNYKFKVVNYENLTNSENLKNVACCGVFTQKIDASNDDMYELLSMFLKISKNLRVNSFTFNFMSPTCDEIKNHLFYPNLDIIFNLISKYWDCNSLDYFISNSHLKYESLMHLKF